MVGLIAGQIVVSLIR